MTVSSRVHMYHSDHPVITLNKDGAFAGAKPWEEIDHTTDVLHAVHVFGVTPLGKLLLSRIPDIGDTHVLIDGLWSTSAATLIRIDEERDDAALRLLAEDLDCESGNPIFLGDTLDRADGDIFRLHSSYYVHLPYDLPEKGSDGREYKAVDTIELEELLRTPEALSPWCCALLDHHKATLPL